MVLDADTEARLRWQNSPLVSRMNLVARASLEHHNRGHKVGANSTTARIVGAAEDLRLMIEEIGRGERDGLGYPNSRE